MTNQRIWRPQEEEGTMAGRSLPFGTKYQSRALRPPDMLWKPVERNVDESKQLVKPMTPICRHIVIDWSDVNLADSAGLGALVSLKVSAASAAYCSLEFAARKGAAAHHET